MPGRGRAHSGGPQGGAAAGRPANDRECACAGQLASGLIALLIGCSLHGTSGLTRKSPAGGEHIAANSSSFPRVASVLCLVPTHVPVTMAC